MPKTPYLAKRGGVWWRRRRPPSLPRLGNLRLTIGAVDGASATDRPARGHLAVSLRTGCLREARRRAARIAALSCQTAISSALKSARGGHAASPRPEVMSPLDALHRLRAARPPS